MRFPSTSSALFFVFVLVACMLELSYQTKNDSFDASNRGDALMVLLIGTLVFLGYRGLTRGRKDD